MKTVSPILLSLFLFFAPGLSARNMSLNDAVKGGLVKASIIVKYESGSPMQAAVVVENLTDFPVNVELELGRTLEPGDPEKQNVVVAEPMVFVLGGREKKGDKSYVYCIQKHDSSPEETRMTLAGMAPAELIGLLRIVNANQYFDSPQSAIWCLTDAYSPSEISGDYSEMDEKLRNYVLSVTANEDYYEEYSQAIPVRNVNISTTQSNNVQPMAGEEESGSMRTLRSTFDVKVASTDKVEIVAFDANGNKVEDIRSFQHPAPGLYHFNLTSTSSAFNQPVWVKVIQNGETLSEKFFN